jgi:hypothetical protein
MLINVDAFSRGNLTFARPLSTGHLQVAARNYGLAWLERLNAPQRRWTLLVATCLTAAIASTAVVARYPPSSGSSRHGVMLILRGIASSDRPRGQLDDRSAIEYARRLGYQGEVLDVAGNNARADNPQVRMALDRIRRDERVTAIYGFSGGGYNTRRIWSRLNSAERQRVRKVVVVGSPGVGKADFPGSADVVIEKDPPAGHMAGPKALLESVGSGG